MGQELVIVPAGLYTDPSPHGAAPPGALRTATNVVLRRAGSVEPRPGFQQHRKQPQVDLAQVHAILGYPGTDAVLYVGQPHVTNTTFLVDEVLGTAVAVTMDSGAALPWTRGFIQAAAIRKNLYLSTADNVRKITSGSDPTASKVGVAPCLLSVFGPGTSPGVAVLTDTAVSYRAVVLRTDANGLIIRSAPSNRWIFRNSSGATVNPSIVINLHTQDDNADIIQVELYRSTPVGVNDTPFDEHFYAKTIAMAAGAYVSPGLTRDDVAPEDLGRALYTNDDEEGAAHANIRPPQAKDVQEFNGSLFLANLTYPAQMFVRFLYTDALLATDANGVGQRQLTGTYTNGSAVVTGVVSTVGFRVGQVIDESLNEWAGTTDLPRIISLTGTTVTFSANYTGTTGSKSRFVFDSIRINNQYFPVGAGSWAACLQAFWDGGIFGTHTPLTNAYVLTEDTLTALSAGTARYPNNRTILIKASNPTTSPFLVYATHGNEYSPPLPEPTATGKTADQDIFPSGVAWSKTFEPEHFSLVDLELIGSDRADTWRIKKGRDALWVLKTDGLWRCAGAGRDAGFRFDPVSKAKLITPNCVADVFDQVYAWTDQGILGLDSGANAVQSQAVRDQLITLQSVAGRFVTLYDTWLCPNQKAHEIVLCLQDPAVDPAFDSYLLVYNFLTNAWTRWDLHKPPSCGGGPLGALQFGIREPALEGGLTYVTTREGLSLNDSTYDISVTSVSGSNVTIAPGSGWVPLPGDALDGGTSLVVGVTDATHFTVNLPVSVGPNTALVAYQCEIEPVACTSKNPSIVKLWQDGSELWGDLVYIRNYTLEFRSSLSDVPATTQKSTGVSFIFSGPWPSNRSHRFIVPRAHARSEQLFVKLIIRNAGGVPPTLVWRWQGLNLFYSPMGPRVKSK